MQDEQQQGKQRGFVRVTLDFGWEPKDANIGNRMHQLSAGFMLALVTGRAFVIDHLHTNGILSLHEWYVVRQALLLIDCAINRLYCRYDSPCFDWAVSAIKNPPPIFSQPGNKPNVLEAGITTMFKHNDFLGAMAEGDLNALYPQQVTMISDKARLIL
jgi:hypothetical protein